MASLTQIFEDTLPRNFSFLSLSLPCDNEPIDSRLGPVLVVWDSIKPKVGELRSSALTCSREEVAEERGAMLRMSDFPAEDWRSQFLIRERDG
jgi:hypothetical protein